MEPEAVDMTRVSDSELVSVRGLCEAARAASGRWILEYASDDVVNRTKAGSFINQLNP
jgi:hypothetical protein